MIPTLQEKFFMEGVFFCKIRAMGGRMVLLEGHDYEDLKELVENGRDWLGCWFSKIKPWSSTTIAVERFVWIKCLGLPLHAWKTEYFQSFGNLWGTFVSLDDSTSGKKRLDVARFLITTPMMESISKSLDIKVNGVMYHIKFFEEEHSNGFYIMESDFKIKGDNHIDEDYTEESSGEEEHNSIGSKPKHTGEGAEAEIESVDLWVPETVMEEGEKKLDEVACILDNTSTQKPMNTQNGQQKQKTDTTQEFKSADNMQEEETAKRKEPEGIAMGRSVRTSNKHLLLEGLGEDVRQQNTKMGECSNDMGTGNNSKEGFSVEGSWESNANNTMGLSRKAGRRNGPTGSGNITKPKERSNGPKDNGNSSSPLALQRPNKKGKKLVIEKMTQQVGFEADPAQVVAGDSINDNNIQNCNTSITVKDNIRDTEALWNRIKDLGVSTTGDEIPVLRKLELRKLEEMELRDKGVGRVWEKERSAGAGD
ncbi:hypothetical protein SLEP1_g16689 [Rubroshorea leprosula]|uniref:DUF4283 domain-containing protein n=1 Tax=Rubroshorea leprosula TaxID=152421 RepID=A0AAV5IRQ4_9ROSI|nr:hypothetical protein SLEP1_g16689 [Rubroshorea leprosula]